MEITEATPTGDLTGISEDPFNLERPMETSVLDFIIYSSVRDSPMENDQTYATVIRLPALHAAGVESTQEGAQLESGAPLLTTRDVGTAATLPLPARPAHQSSIEQNEQYAQVELAKPSAAATAPPPADQFSPQSSLPPLPQDLISRSTWKSLLGTLLPRLTRESFATSFWLDNYVLVTQCAIPLVVALVLFLRSYFAAPLARCILSVPHNVSASDYLNGFCYSQLSHTLLTFRSTPQIDTSESESPRWRWPLVLQAPSQNHTNVPFLLLVYALLGLVPHLIWQLRVRRRLLSELWLVRTELDALRESAACEFYAALVSRALSPSASTSAATGTGLRPGRWRRSPLFRSAAFLPSLAPSAGVLDPMTSVARLPQFLAASNDWSLAHRLAEWQQSTRLFHEYLCKHVAHLTLHVLCFLPVGLVALVERGGIMASEYRCALPLAVQTMFKAAPHAHCVLIDTPHLNIALALLSLSAGVAVGVQVAFFYRFTRHSLAQFERVYVRDSFFGAFISLVAYTQYAHALRRLVGVHVNLVHGFELCDQHLIDELCLANEAQLHAVRYVRYWVDRFVRSTQQRAAAASSAINPFGVAQLRGGRGRGVSLGLLRSEDLSSRLSFSKLRVRLEFAENFS